MGPDVPVTFYDGDPLRGGAKLGTVYTSLYLEPGELEDVALTLSASTATVGSIWVVADDFGGLLGTVTESDETNNAFDSGKGLSGGVGTGTPDLTVANVDVASVVVEGQTLEVSGSVAVSVRNQTETAVTGSFVVTVFEDRDGDGALGASDVVLGTTTLASLDAGTTMVAGVSARERFSSRATASTPSRLRLRPSLGRAARTS